MTKSHQFRAPIRPPKKPQHTRITITIPTFPKSFVTSPQYVTARQQNVAMPYTTDARETSICVLVIAEPYS